MSVRKKKAAQQNGESQHTETKSQRPERRAERPLGGKREGSCLDFLLRLVILGDYAVFK